MENQPFIGSALVIEEVKDRWDILETPVTGMPKKLRCAYINWENSVYHGALLTKKDLQKLKKMVRLPAQSF